jgi:hypothetical protein
MRNLVSKTFLVTLAAVGALGGPLRAEDAKLVQTNLVSDISGLATITDSNLMNPWGVSHSATSPLLGLQPENEHCHSLRRYRRDGRQRGRLGCCDPENCPPGTARTYRPGQQWQP